MPSGTPKPPYDPELLPFLATFPLPQPITLDLVLATRAAGSGLLNVPGIEEIIGGRPVSHVDRSIPGLSPGDPEVTVAVFAPECAPEGPRPCVVWIHGGGMVLGDRFTGIALPLRWVADVDLDAVVVSVQYRLAPEDPFPAGVNDCYAALRWAAARAGELGVDPDRIVVAGQSGGGGVAAGVCLTAREGGPKVCAQFLSCPMLDDRSSSVSCAQYAEGGTWGRESNRMAWEAVLGSGGGGKAVSAYAAPARAADLSGLPTTFVDVGSAEIFRDECVDFASRLWAAGTQAELHVYAGAFHGVDAFAATSRVGALVTSTQSAWLKRVLTPPAAAAATVVAGEMKPPREADLPAPGDAIGGL